jgi:hypothetical protein
MKKVVNIIHEIWKLIGSRCMAYAMAMAFHRGEKSFVTQRDADCIVQHGFMPT